MAAEIRAARQTSEVQEYEVIVPYRIHESRSPQFKGRPWTATLLPPPGDMCLSILEERWPLPSGPGRPVRIDKGEIALVLGPLPREIRGEWSQ